MKVCVIGLGEIGWETFKEISKSKNHEMIGVEVLDSRIKEINPDGKYQIGKVIPSEADVYIISVYTPQQIRDFISQINLKRKPLVVIESTLQPGETKKMVEDYPGIKLVLFPHRYNPKDPEHHVFNLNRLISAYDEEALMKALSFYGEFISNKRLFIVEPEIAELSKPLENAYRYIEIAIAEEIKMMCEEKGISFDHLRAAMNTKWNIDLKEARNGIGGKCLPKDCKFINKFFQNNVIFEAALAVDDIYRLHLKGKGEETEGYREVES
jgi:UDP-N-acetyl-D-mannosaminuronic acid dehydrogenase